MGHGCLGSHNEGWSLCLWVDTGTLGVVHWVWVTCVLMGIASEGDLKRFIA